MTPVRHFLGNHSPFVQSVSQFLSANTKQAEVVLVPTSLSADRLRVQLEKDQVHGIQVWTLRAFFEQSIDNLASEEAVELLWVEALRACSAYELEDLVREVPGKRDFLWCLKLAKQLILAEREWLSTGRAVEPFLEEFGRERWRRLFAISTEVKKRLLGLRSWSDFLRYGFEGKSLEQKTSILIAGVHDLDPVFEKYLLDLSPSLAVLVGMEDHFANRFDDWGRPLKGDFWEKINLVKNESHLLVRQHLGETVEAAMEGVTVESLSDSGWVALSDDWADAIIPKLTQRGIAARKPEQGRLSETALVNWLNQVKSFNSGYRYRDLSTLLRDPLSWELLGLECGFDFVCLLDRFEYECLPSQVSFFEYKFPIFLGKETEREVANFSDIEAFIEALLAYSKKLGIKGEYVATIKELAIAWSQETLAEAIVKALNQVIEEESWQALPVSEQWAYLMQVWGRVFQPSEVEGVMVTGWLEALYDSAPELTVLGVDSQNFPSSSVESSWIQSGERESFTANLDWDKRGALWARDAFLIYQMSAHRTIRFAHARQDYELQSNHPSKLMLQGLGPDLPERVRCFIKESDFSERTEMEDAATELLKRTIPRVSNPYSLEQALPKPLSPSTLKSYLECPTLMYLKHVLKLEPAVDHPVELNALQFGNLVHHALDEFGQDTSIRNSEKVSEIQAFLRDQVERYMSLNYGASLSIALDIQKESVIERLNRFAEVQVKERQNGWAIIASELEVSPHQVAWYFAGSPIFMRIDRVDRHEDGRIRVVDYKTSQTARHPKETHLKVYKEGMADFYTKGLDEIPKRVFNDLQLPLYAEFSKHHFLAGSRLPEVAYFNLSSAMADIGFFSWGKKEDYTEELHREAMLTAKHAIEAIQKGEFFNPTPHHLLGMYTQADIEDQFGGALAEVFA